MNLSTNKLQHFAVVQGIEHVKLSQKRFLPLRIALYDPALPVRKFDVCRRRYLAEDGLFQLILIESGGMRGNSAATCLLVQQVL
jgi:hypothetical protein